MNFKLFFIIANLVLAGMSARAEDAAPADNSQNLDEQEVINVENLYKNNPPPAAKPVTQEAPPPVTKEELREQSEIKNNVDVKNSKVRSLDDLNKLAPFSDISVIQKKFLPKTGRFQLYTAGGLTTNSPWFLNLGAKVNLGYHFSESFGMELSGMFLTNSELDSAKDLKQNNNLQPDKFVVTKYNLGLDVVWSPIYGKITNLNNEIIPFDMYFALGAGTSSTTSQEGNVPTFHLGTGQIFALSKSFAFRWDYSWNFYQATPVPDAAAASVPGKSTYNDLIFTAGVSFFFPEVSTR